MSEIVQKKIEMKIYKSPFTDNQIMSELQGQDIKVKKLGKDSFYLGEVWVNDRIYGVLELEKEYWADKAHPDLDFLDRIILKLLDKTGKNIGIIEERLLKELMQSVVSGELPVFSITLRGIPYLIDIEKEKDKLVFPVLINKSQKIFEIFQISKKSLALGADYVVKRKLTDQKVADIDSKRGGKIEIKIYDDEIAEKQQFVDSLALFAGTIKFHEGIGDKIKQALEALELGSLVLKPPKKALELMVNPRKAKRAKTKTDEEEKERKRIRKRTKKRKIRGKDELEDEEEEQPKKKRALKKKSKAKKDDAKSKKYKSLLPDDPVTEASGVTTAIAAELNQLGIQTVEDLIAADPGEIADLLDDPKIISSKIKQWISVSRKRIKATLEVVEAGPEDSDDYDLLDYGF